MRHLVAAWNHRSALTRALLPLASIYTAATALRRWAYRSGWLRCRRVGVPVIVVGNLIAGGAGKTPTVIALCELLGRRGYRVGIVSRGYGGTAASVREVTSHTQAKDCGDEPLLLKRRTGAPVFVGHDRVEAAKALLRTHPETDAIVSDDGLQHLALARDAQVLVFDARGTGNGWLLPAGPLRETVPRRVPPRTLVLYNAPRPSTALPGSLARRSLNGVVSLRGWWLGERASTQALRSLQEQPLVAVAGIAQPVRFFDMLRAEGLTIVELPLPDHASFEELPWPATTQAVVLTEKDAVKLQPDRIGATRVWVAPLDFTFDAAFEAALLALLPPPGVRHGNAPAQSSRLPHLQGSAGAPASSDAGQG